MPSKANIHIPCIIAFIHTMSSSALTLAVRRLANPARPILTASTSAPTPQSYFLLHHSPGCPAGSRLRWPYAHLRSMHTHIPHSITHEVVGAYLGPWKRQTRAFACGGLLQLKRTQYPSRPKVPEEDFEENFVKGSGPGGQKINKTNSAVQLRHIPTGVVVKSQATRSRAQNRKLARRLLAEKLDELGKGSDSRTAILRMEVSKRKKNKDRKAKRKYVKLAAKKAACQASDGSTADSSGHSDSGSNPKSSPVNDLSASPDI